MPTVHIARILKDLGTNSVRELFRRTGSPEQSVFRQGQMAAIDWLYRANMGVKGPFGLPLMDYKFEGHTAERQYSGGQIKFLDNQPRGGDVWTRVRVRFVGFRCDSESDWDQSSGSDEPYFIIGVAAANRSKTTRFGPYEDINSGTVRFEATEVASTDDKITPPVALLIAAIEHDQGSEEEAENKVRDAVRDIEDKFDQAVGSFMGSSTDNHVMPEWLRDIVIGWFPEWIAAGFGFADDEIGKTALILFDNKADLLEWRARPVQGKHGSNEWNYDVDIDGGDEGKYKLYFMVDLFDDPDPTIRPYA